ncbi:MAG: bifunctional salicylyl-CoA 5-hydroxylase/oxidoreductase, partial [Gemmatimonadota bacterium]
SGIGRRRLLEILHARCAEVGVTLRFETPVADDIETRVVAEGLDLVLGAGGVNGRYRQYFAETFQPDVDLRHCRYTWLGTPRTFDAFTFDFVETEHGWFQAHAYQFDDAMSTFIVETQDRTWEAAGLWQMTEPQSIAFCERLFADRLGGAPLVSNAAHLRGSAQWIRFPRIACASWVHWIDAGARRVPFVLVGDVAHTSHFSIGSGTKLAMEDAIALDAAITATPDDLAGALARYHAERSVEVLKLQNAARNSTEWFEHVDRYATLAPEQFAYSLLTRSQRISHENLRERDAADVADFERWFAARTGLPTAPTARPVPPVLTPFTVRDVTLP